MNMHIFIDQNLVCSTLFFKVYRTICWSVFTIVTESIEQNISIQVCIVNFFSHFSKCVIVGLLISKEMYFHSPGNFIRNSRHSFSVFVEITEQNGNEYVTGDANFTAKIYCDGVAFLSVRLKWREERGGGIPHNKPGQRLPSRPELCNWERFNSTEIDPNT